MKLTTEDFNEPNEHPAGMLSGCGIQHACEGEEFLAFLLRQCIKQKSFEPVQCKFSHDDLVGAGLLSTTAEKSYALTDRAIRMLYVHYGK